MTYLVSIAFGPVQDFINAARRTRDLWYGSHLLSDLGKHIARNLIDNRGAELVFPNPTDPGTDLQQGSSFSVPNKLLLVLDAPDDETLKRWAREWRKDTKIFLAGRMQAALLRAEPLQLDTNRMERQLSDFAEFYTAWVPYDESAYASCLAEVEELAAGRKALRDFHPFPGEAGIPKSSLDGIRESVILGPFENNGRHVVDPRFRVRKDERLDAVGIIKRLGATGKPPKFDSTHDVAAGPLFARLQKENPATFEEYKSAASGLSSRAEPLYRRRLDVDYIISRDTLTRLDRLRASLLKDRRPQPPYYALLAGDGDSVGRFIRELAKLDGPGKRRHQAFSTALADFASAAVGILRGPSDADTTGMPVYTGGDDVLALLPLHKTLECAWLLRSRFLAAMRSLQFPGDSPTFSAGIAVAHAMEPLTSVRALARAAEQRAKDSGRDSLAITVSPRSGADITTCGKWNKLAPLLFKTVHLYYHRKLSLGFAHELTFLCRPGRPELDDVRLALARAIAGKKEQSDDAVHLLDGWMQGSNDRDLLESFVNTLLVARSFARAYREAEEPPPDKPPQLQEPASV